jgi:RES domain-containing protein
MGRKQTVSTTEVATVCYRYSDYDTPFWARANTMPGRWHSIGDGATQYLSCTTDGAWADLIRTEDLRTPDELKLVRMPLWQVKIDQSYVVDYSEFELAEVAGFPAEALIDDDRSRCRIEGRRLRDAGYSGVLAPSAALPGSACLTLFGPRVAIDWSSRPSLSSAIPSSILTEGAPPIGVLGRVRFRGQSHSGYQAYLAHTATQEPGDHVRVRRKRPADDPPIGT